ncbi:hypothetical protein [Nitrospira calida]
MLLDFEQWLRRSRESAADSWLEAFEELLTLHRLKVPAALRTTLHSTNPIERRFATVRDCERDIKRYRNNQTRQRGVVAMLLHAEQGCRRVKGHAVIEAVVVTIEATQAEAECRVA